MIDNRVAQREEETKTILIDLEVIHEDSKSTMKTHLKLTNADPECLMKTSIKDQIQLLNCGMMTVRDTLRNEHGLAVGHHTGLVVVGIEMDMVDRCVEMEIDTTVI